MILVCFFIHLQLVTMVKSTATEAGLDANQIIKKHDMFLQVVLNCIKIFP